MEATRLYGREREQALLRGHLDRLCDGSGGLVLIGGEAGIGKTALVDELVREARRRRLQAHTGASHDLEATPPFGPWRDAGWERRALPDGQALDVPPILRDEAASEPPGDPRAAYALAIQFIKQSAQPGPLVLVLEDLHWADQESLELLRMIAREAHELPLLLVCTYRDDELEAEQPLAQVLPALVREGRAHRINLRRLSNESVDALLRDRVGLAEDDHRRLAHFVFRSSEGNPLVLEEVLRALEEERTLERREGVWRLGELVDQPIPHLIRLVIERRLQRFDGRQRELLALAALIDRDVEFDIWCAVAGADPEDLSDLAEQATAARLLVPRPDSGALRFSHALIRAALYQQLGPLARRQSHLRVAELLLARANQDAERLAHHFEQANDPRAGEWYALAADRALRLGARTTAADRMQAALRSMEAHNAPPEERAYMLGRMAWVRLFSDSEGNEDLLDQALELLADSADDNLKASLLVVRGEHFIWNGRLQAAISDLKQASTYFRLPEPGEPARWIRNDAPSDDPTLALILSLVAAGHYAEAIELVRARLGVDLDGPPEVLAQLGFALSVMSICVADMGQPQLGLKLYGQFRALLAASTDAVLIGGASMWALFTFYTMYFTDDLAAQQRLADESERNYRIASAQGDIGNWPPELTRIQLLEREGAWRRVLQLANAGGLDHPNFIVRQYVMATLANILRRSGDSAGAWKLIYQALPAGAQTEPGNSAYIPSIRLQQVAIQLCLGEGDHARAGEWLAANARWLDWSTSTPGRTWHALLQAQAALARGERAGARQQLERGIALAREPRQPSALQRGYQLLADLEIQTGKLSDALLHLSQALQLAHAMQARYEVALVETAIARVHLLRGERDTARAVIAKARATLEELGALPAIERADALLDQLEHGPPPALTAREHEVLHLLTTGMTNSEIATRLYISPRTVDQHLRRIYAKLNVTSRTAATRYALDHGLISDRT